MDIPLSHFLLTVVNMTAETKDITSHKHLEVISGTKKFGLRFTFSTKKSNSWTTAPGNSAQNPIWTDFLPVLMKCTQKEILPQSLAIFAQLSFFLLSQWKYDIQLFGYFFNVFIGMEGPGKRGWFWEWNDVHPGLASNDDDDHYKLWSS